MALGLGGNVGNRLKNIALAQHLIEKQLGVIDKYSNIYETAAWGNTDQPAFLNQAILIKTPFTPLQTLHIVLQIEKQMGRFREIKWAPRIIDIDILLYNQTIINKPQLQIPHPFMHERRFVLKPLAEIMPNTQHPTFKKSFRDLLTTCQDSLSVEPIFI